GPRPGGHGGPFGGMGMPAERSMNFLPSAKRLLGRLRPDRGGVIGVILLGVASVVLSVIGPKILGEATNLIFEGAISATLPAGMTQEQIVAALEASGDTERADLIRNMHLVPGQGIDFAALQLVIGLALLVYVFASVFGWAQAYVLNGITQRTVFRLREDVESKLH